MQEKVTELTRENTVKLERLVQLKKQRNDFESDLNQGQSTLVTFFNIDG